MQYHIEVVSKLGRRIRLSKRYWESIVKKHESVVGLEAQARETLATPQYVRTSQEDDTVFLYYAPYKKYFLCVVCRHLNGEGFIITVYLTDKKGATVYEAH